MALFELDPRPRMGPDRLQCALDCLRGVVEAGGLRPVQLDPAQVLGADEPVLVRTDEPHWGAESAVSTRPSRVSTRSTLSASASSTATIER